VFKPELSSI